MKHSKLLLLVSLVLCIKLGVAQKRNKCPNMQLVRCSNQFQGVCAFFKDDSCKDLSQKYSANTCIACMDSRVKYVVDGPCNGDKVFCDANIRPEFCTREYFPVCGYNSKCKGDNCGIPAGNKCMACANSEIEWYVQGECPQGDDTDDNNSSDNNTNDDDSDNNDNEVTCDPDNRPEVCTDIYAPVCATTSECDDDHCYLTTHTAGNACYACGDDKVISYIPGECPPAATRCDPRNRPEVCDLVYAPVCATLQTCNRRECTETNETFGNDCLACGNPDVISHIPGECPEA